MRLLAPESAAVVYVISCELGVSKIGVAVDARERRRALQVGSPVLLELAGCYRFATARAAYAVVAELRRQLGERWVRGGWYRVSAQEVAEALESRGAHQAAARQAAGAAEAAPREERVGLRRGGRAQRRREKVRALARLRAAGATQRAAAGALGVDERTVRRWTKLPGYAAELAKARGREERHPSRGREPVRTVEPEAARPAAGRGGAGAPLERQPGQPQPEPRTNPPAQAIPPAGLPVSARHVQLANGRERRWVETETAELEALLARGWRPTGKTRY
jgi:hypothetical protein